MCGIAGIIHRDGPGDIGAEMTRMLQSMKHRGPDSSGFALYGPPSDLLVMRIKLADPNEARGFGWSERLERHRNEVEHRLAKIGAMVDVMHGDQEYAYRVTFRYSGELKPLADYMEDVPGCEVLLPSLSTRRSGFAICRWRFSPRSRWFCCCSTAAPCSSR